MFKRVELIEQVLVCCVRLSAKLRLESEQHNASFAVRKFECRGFAFDCLRMQQQAALQRVGLLGIASEHCTMEPGQRLERRTWPETSPLENRRYRN